MCQETIKRLCKFANKQDSYRKWNKLVKASLNNGPPLKMTFYRNDPVNNRLAPCQEEVSVVDYCRDSVKQMVSVFKYAGNYQEVIREDFTASVEEVEEMTKQLVASFHQDKR